MSTITKKDLSIFRGTYLECKAQPTEDMRIYLAWDTQEIYIGNSYGEKVLYGVSKSLFRRIDEKFVILDNSIAEKVDNHIRDNIDLLVQDELERIKEELFAEVENEVIVKVNEKVVTLTDNISTNTRKIESTEIALEGLSNNLSKHVEDFEKTNTELTTYKGTINTELTQLKQKDSEILTTISNKETSLNNSISAVNTRVDNTNSAMNEMENRVVAKSTYSSDKTTIENAIETERNRITAINDKIFDENDVNKIDKNAEDISAIITRTSTLETNYTAVRTDVTDLNTRVLALEDDTGSGDDGNCLIYIDGDDLSTDARDNNFALLKSYITENRRMFVIFCMSDSNSNFSSRYRYKRGTLYFFDGASITTISGGSGGGAIEKDIITANITGLTISGWKFGSGNATSGSIEIHDTTYTFKSGDITFTVTDANKIITSLALKYNNSDISYLNTSGNCSSTSGFSFSASTPGTHSVTLSASAKADDEYTDYQLSGGSQTKSITFYKPVLFGIDGNLKHYSSSTGTFSFGNDTNETIPANATILYYTPSSTELDIKTTDGFGAGFVKTDGTVKLTVNEIENIEYYEYKLENVNDTSVVFVIKKKEA